MVFIWSSGRKNGKTQRKDGQIMNETLQVIKSRRSIRQFQFEQISDAELQVILEAAIAAPSAMNQQKWHFTVVQDRKVIDEIVKAIIEANLNSGNEVLMKKVKDPLYDTFYYAPTVIFISADMNAPWVQLDCGMAMQNMMLAAESLGLGSCAIASARLVFQNSHGFEEKLHFPAGYQYVCAVAIGYINGAKPSPPSKKQDVFTYIK